ncbi:MAG TPA: FG-GAP-like repeat-containing protein [Pirellulales bacterium]|nr:FG-GAP-like repeat-containing protein [Pirellulales bacterium]
MPKAARHHASRGPRFSHRTMAVCAAGVLAIAVFWRIYHTATSPSAAQVTAALADAKQALAAGRFVDAEQSAAKVLADKPRSAEALLIAGEAASRAGRLPAALAYYQRLPDSRDPRVVLGRCAAADIEFRLGAWQRAEEDFRKVLEDVPDQPLALARLTDLLTLESRGRAAVALRLRRIALGDYSPDNLVFLGDVQRLAEIPRELWPADENEADWPVLLGLAALALDQQDYRRCQALLDRILTGAPDRPKALVLQGQVLLALSPEQFLDWRRSVPAGAAELPGFWVCSGDWLQAQGEFSLAARAFWEAVRRQPQHRTAHDRLAQVLAALGRQEQASYFAERARLLEELVGLVVQARHDAQNADLLRRCAESTEQLGRLWEAYGWCRLGLRVDPRNDWAGPMVSRIEPRLGPKLSQTADEANPALVVDLSDLPRADWQRISAVHRPAKTARHESSPVVFDEVAQRVGIDFVYCNGHDPRANGPRMFEFSGGGCAVLDFDGDGLPDLHFTQGCAWPPRAGQLDHLDRLYRNCAGRAFEDVTYPARLAENRFSQGVAVGDFNQDGFADLYIANIGGNRLLVNQGDGTFADVSEAAGLTGDAWTTSCLMADVNGDGLPDLYDVNYVMGTDVFERVCQLGGRPSLCAPGVFEPQPDRLWINLGDGRFADASPSAGVEVAGGNGLGIVAADFNDSGQLSLFVANDQDANFYFANQAPRGGPPRFEEQGVIAGLAFDGRGRAQACMGIAAGDPNRDGRLDLFVTNFYRETNTLYLASEYGFFSDATAASGLAQASFTRLGFGAQFVDANLDGWEDLVVANGHIDDRTQEGIPYAMRPQVFVNTGQGRFVEQSDAAGDYFRRERLARALAKIDWNGDGREDLVASHLDAPAALLTNVSPQAGHFLAVELRGVNSARDAIGARVQITSGGETCWRRLTAGDGYQASNERRLVFGLGTHRTAERLTVHWPAGAMQTFHHLPADNSYRIVEGRSEAVVLP